MSATAHRVLVVEDDEDVRDLVVMSLESDGLDVTAAATGAEGLALCRDLDPDLVTLDLSLPDADGVEVCGSMRGFTDAYIIMVTGRDDEASRLAGLEVGADDYLSKPFSPHELRARAAALLRRPRMSVARGAGPADVVAGRLVVSSTRRDAFLDGQPLRLGPAELDVLTVLASDPGRSWDRERLTLEIGQGGFVESDYLVDVHIGNLRRKLRAAGERHRWIATVDGVAYRLDPDPPA